MLIDDDRDDQEFFLEALKTQFPEANCTIASDYPSALDKLSKRLIDIPKYIFLDWSLPNSDVRESVKQMKGMEDLRQSAFFILSGSMPPLSPAVIQELGIEKVLLKQNSIPELSQELSTAIVLRFGEISDLAV